MRRVEPWERPHVRRYLLTFLAAGLSGTGAVLLVVLLFRWVGWSSVSAGILSVAWMVAGLLTIPSAFHEGAELERQRQQRLVQ